MNNLPSNAYIIMARPKKSSSKSAASRVERRRFRRARRVESEFKNVRCEGGVLPAEFLASLASGDVEGLRAEDYKLDPGERLNERIADAWARCKRNWENFQTQRKYLPDDDYGTTITRKFWLIPLLKILEYGEPETQRAGVEAEGKKYQISHRVNFPVALHLVSFRQSLDSRDAENAAGAKVSPHSLMQEYLNQEKKYLWGFVSNGLQFRILRDNISFVRAAYVEFDLETIMETDAYAEFYLFFLLAHSSRVARQNANEEEFELQSDDEEAKEPEEEDLSCWLEKWHTQAQKNGVRALEGLQSGVMSAINSLGAGFLERRENESLRDLLRAGTLSTQEYYNQLLLLAYRLVFLQIAEDRGLFFPPSQSKETKETNAKRDLYMKGYSLSRIRKLSRHYRGSRHCDLWEQLKRTLAWCAEGQDALDVPALGSALFAKKTVFDDCRLSNSSLLAAVRTLTHTTKNNLLQQIDYRNLGVEELGSVYESLLEMQPEISGNRFELKIVAGNARKTTGSFYTPPSLVGSLLDTALVPVMEEALAEAKTTDEKEKALLNLKVCDPASGSGHFLIGAARRLGKRLAQLRTGELEPAPIKIHAAERDVIARCLYGVDINPMAVELCKVSLWIESMEPGKSLMFLDHRLKCGNSLLGVPFDFMERGIPDEAFEPLEGDDKKICALLKKNNQKEREDEIIGQGRFTDDRSYAEETQAWTTDYIREAKKLDALPNDDVAAYRAREKKYSDNLRSIGYDYERTLADLWCSAFVWPKTTIYEDFNPTHAIFADCRKKGSRVLSDSRKKRIHELADEYRFFHWKLEFPDVFDGEKDGFDVVLGNPPWERVKLQEKEWFAMRAPEIADAKNKAEREKMIKNLREECPELLVAFRAAQRKAEATSAFIRTSRRFPLCGRGDVNTYAVFAELNTRLVSSRGRVGCVTPSGIATDATYQTFFQELTRWNRLRSLYDFENRKKLFPAVDSRMKFSLLTISSPSQTLDGAEFAFFNLAVPDVQEEGRAFTLTSDDIDMINPNTRTCPIFRSVKDAELTKAIYRRVPVLFKEEVKRSEPDETMGNIITAGNKIEEIKLDLSYCYDNPWGVRFNRMFDMANDSNLFRSKNELEDDGFELRGAKFVRDDGAEYWPLYEAKMIHHYNHRFGDYRDLPEGSKSTQLPNIPSDRLKKKDYAVLPRYWVEKSEVLARLQKSSIELKKEHPYLIGFRSICRSTDERTQIATVIPTSAVSGKYPLFFVTNYHERAHLLYADFSSFAHDYVARQKIGGTDMAIFAQKQIPTLPPEKATEKTTFLSAKTYLDFVLPRVLELTYTASDLRGFAESCGDHGEPFVWDDRRRFLLRCELDALYFGLYLGFGEWSEAEVYDESEEDRATLAQYFPTPLDALDHVMGTFPIVKRKELADELKTSVAKETLEARGLELGDRYPTHAVVRAMYREMVGAIREGKEWKTWLDPAPADDSCRHPAG